MGYTFANCPVFWDQFNTRILPMAGGELGLRSKFLKFRSAQMGSAYNKLGVKSTCGFDRLENVDHVLRRHAK
jgi:hypothetical protein